MKTNAKSLLLLAAGACCALSAAAQVTLNLDAGRLGPEIGPLHYGIFFEEINHAGDGGLYAELVQNRSLEDASTPTAWSAIGSAEISVSTGALVSDAQGRALQVHFMKAGDGVANSGFWGMNIQQGLSYDLQMWVDEADAQAPKCRLAARLVAPDGSVLGQAEIKRTQQEKNNWAKHAATIVAEGSDAAAHLEIVALDGEYKGRFDVVSLFPPTFKDRPNGCRPDLAQMLADMKPAFMRFPGGCFVEGQWRDGKTNRFDWRQTIGPIEDRPGHQNVNWNYRVTDGLGFHEMLQLAEDLGAEPLFVVNVGMGHGWCEDYRTGIQPFIQEALDAIEYCNGSTDTHWGAIRAANGHPEPFNLRLLEIGNENYNFSFSNNNDQSDHYAERYMAFYQAIKAVYPEMIMIGNVEAWGTDNPSWRNPYPVDAVDEHYYRNPAWFAGQYSKYDSYPRDSHKIYVGEYAVTQNFGVYGNLDAALGEAIYMLGMENNSDVVVMNSYAPIFVNEHDQKWMPDMIRFNSAQCYGTPSYYVQQLMPNYVGRYNVGRSEAGNGTALSNSMGLSTWSTTAAFDNVKITAADGSVIFADDFSAPSDAWKAAGGAWSVADGVLNQTDRNMQGAIYSLNTQIGDAYTIELDATKKDGAEGFLIAFKYADAANYAWWNLGGWGNSQHAIEVCANGAKQTVASTAGSLQTGRTYHLRVSVDGSRVKCYMDGALMFDATLPVQRKLYFASSIDPEEGCLYVKVVNNTSKAEPVDINIANARAIDGEAIVLKGNSLSDENTGGRPQNVAPVTSALSGVQDSGLQYTAPAFSLSILKIKVADVAPAQQGPAASEQDVTAAKAEIKNAMDKANYMHTAMTLPAGTSDARIEWAFNEAASGYAALTRTGWTQMLDVVRLPDDEPLLVGTLTAKLFFHNGTEASVEYPVTFAPEDTDYGYLYCYMNSGKEITNYALGARSDLGLVFNQLLGGAEIFDTNQVAAIEHGTRDAFLAKGQRPDEYFMTTTDMCNAASGVWSNYGMDMLRSTDLIHWESTTFDFRKGKAIFSDPDAAGAALASDAEYAKIYRVWAPQFIWDPKADAYLVYYSMLSTNSGDSYDKIYYSYADKDFKTLTQPRIFFDPGFAVIDGDIVLSPYDGLYHMYYKREGAQGAARGIYEAVSADLTSGSWTDVMHVTNEGSELSEGSTAVRRINEDFYNLYYMRYTGGSAYKVCVTDHSGLNPSGSVNVSGKGAFQHGSVITLTEQEYKMLEAWDDLMSRLDAARQAQAAGSHAYDEAIAAAETALGFRTVDALSDELPKAIDAMKEARRKYVEEMMNPTEETEITSLLANPNFTSGGDGWLGTSFTAASQGVAEHFDKNFDTYQVLEGMPAGTYRFECSGFYRAGARSVAYNAHAYGEEALNAMLYIGDNEVPFMSLYDESAPYTNSPYTYPDNVTQANNAFNSKGVYGGNSVQCTLYAPADLRLGIRKNAHISTDWTCFDNFRLYYSPDYEGVEAAEAAAEAELVNVYNAAGIMVRSAVPAASATDGLPAGIYMAGPRKVAVQ